MSKDRIAEILATYYEGGAGGDPEKVIAEHPDLADELRSHFAVLRAVEETFQELPEGAPREIGEYRIVRELGRGGMGVVFEAEQASMKRRVALKVLSLAITGTPQAVRRFQREAQAAGRLHHTNIVPVYGLGQHGGYWYYAMELVQGRPLSLVLRDLRRGRQPREESLARLAAESVGTPRRESATGTGARAYFVRVAEMFAGVAEALDLAHREKVIHRDIKPSNLLLDQDGVLKIVDFGLARTMEEGPSLTITGDLIGTPVYMSPEQAMAKRMAVDHRTDIYSLGATLYEALALKPPFEGSSLQEICSKIITKDPVPPRRANAKVPRDLETVVLKAIEKDREKRYATAGAFARDLRRFAEGGAIQARRIGPLGRAWRKVKRHKVRSALVAAALLLAATAGLFAASAAREARRHAELEYAGLCVEAAAAFGPGTAQMSLPDRWQGELSLNVPIERDDRARELLDRAIEQLPGRPEAYVLRALAPGRAITERLADLDHARSRGLDEGTFLRGRAHLLAAAGQWDKAAEAEAQAEPLHVGTAEARYFAAIIFQGRGKRAEARQLLDQAIEEAQAGSLVLRLALRSRSRLLAMEGRFGPAVDDLVRLGDDSVAVRVEIAALWQRLKPDEAERRFDEILADVQETDTAQAWVDLCATCTALRQRSWAVRAAETALMRHDGSAAVRAAYAAALVGSGDLVRGRDAARRAIDLDPLSRDAHMALGLALLRLEHLGEAVDAYKKAKELLPWSVLVRLMLGDVYQMLDRHQEALAEYDGALQLNPRFAKAHLRRGFALHELGEPDQARAAHDEALRLDPDDPEVVTKRGVLEAKQTRYAEALKYFSRAVELDPGQWESLHGKGRALVILGHQSEGLEYFDEAIHLAPSEPSPHLARGMVLRDQGKLDDALKCYDEAARLAPKWALAHLERGAVLGRLGRFKEAAAAFGRWGEFGDPEGYYRCGYLLLQELNSPEEAIEAFDKVGALDDSHPKAALLSFFRGRALASVRRREEAIQAYREAVRLREDYAEAHCNLGGCLREEGRFKEALDSLRRGHELGSRNPRWPWPSAAWVEECERLVELDGKPSQVLVEASPADAQERLALAEVCRAKRLHAAEARFLSEVLAEPDDARGAQHRYDAACAAALAGCGVGEDARDLGEAERQRWRTQALAWLRTELAGWSRQFEGEDREAAKGALDALAHCRQDPDLAGIRDEASLAGLPADERAVWRAFWQELDETLARGR